MAGVAQKHHTIRAARVPDRTNTIGDSLGCREARRRLRQGGSAALLLFRVVLIGFPLPGLHQHLIDFILSSRAGLADDLVHLVE